MIPEFSLLFVKKKKTKKVLAAFRPVRGVFEVNPKVHCGSFSLLFFKLRIAAAGVKGLV
jgi:hypothetical protein